MSDEKKKFFWKGKRVTEKIYIQRVAQSESGMKRKKMQSPTKLTSTSSTPKVDGRRIIAISHLAKHLKCIQCKGLLDLELIHREERYGLGSIFHIKCTNCHIVNRVPTDKLHTGLNDATRCRRFDVNSKIALGKSIN